MNNYDLVWHYTTTAGLIGILQQHELWASSSSFMNDPDEDRFAESAMVAALAGLGSRGAGARSYFENGLRWQASTAPFSERYVVCASRHDDALEMWRAYGTRMVEGTFAVGLDPNSPLGPVVSADSATHLDIRGWDDVDYKSMESACGRAKKALTETFATLDSASTGGLVRGTEEEFGERQVAEWTAVTDIYAELVSTIKHEAYRAEREVRISFDLDGRHPVRLRQGPHGPVPYVALTAAPSWGATVLESKRLPVHKIVTWPGAPLMARRGVAAALASGGHVLRGTWEARAAEELGNQVIVDIAESVIPFV